MALADWGQRLSIFLPLTYTLPVAARLLTTALPCPCRLPDTARPPAAVTKAAPLGRRLRYSTVKEDEREKTRFHTLQETNPRTAMGRDLPPRRRAIMLDRDQGSANSRRSSPGSGASTPLRDAFNWSPPARSPSLQLNHPAPALPLFSAVAHPPGSHFPATHPRAAGPWPRETGPS